MVFTTYIFVFYFLTLVLAGYYALPARSTWRNAWLLGRFLLTIKIASV